MSFGVQKGYYTLGRGNSLNTFTEKYLVHVPFVGIYLRVLSGPVTHPSIIILEHKTPRAYTKTYVGIVRIGVRISGLAILTTKYTLLTSIPRHAYNSLTLKAFCTPFDANTILYDSNAYSTVQKQLFTVKFYRPSGLQWTTPN